MIGERHMGRGGRDGEPRAEVSRHTNVFIAEHTLFNGGLHPRPITSVGSVTESDSAGPQAAPRMAVRTHLNSSQWELTPGTPTLGATYDDPLVNLVLPLVAETVSAVDRVCPDLGWMCVAVGSGLFSRVIEMTTRVMGAAASRTEGSISRLGSTAESVGLGRHVFFVIDAEALSLDAILSEVPAGSSVVLFAGVEPSIVNFYTGVHRKNVSVVGHRLVVTRSLEDRVRRIVESRLMLKDLGPCLQQVRSVEQLDLCEGDTVIAEWLHPGQQVRGG